MNLAPTESPRRILMIATDNTFAHLYDDVAQILEESEYGEKFGGAVEFFDRDGQRLATMFGPDWRLEDLQPTGEPAELAAIRKRMQAVLDHLEQYLRNHPELVEQSRLSLDDALATLPRLDAHCLQDGIDAMPGHVKHHKGNFFHNAMHAAGWGH